MHDFDPVYDRESREIAPTWSMNVCTKPPRVCVPHFVLELEKKKKIVSHSSIILRRLKSQHTTYITCYIRSPRQFNANVCIFTAALTWNLCWFQPQPQFSSHCWVKINLRFFKTVMRMGWEYFTSCSFFLCSLFFFAQSRRGTSHVEWKYLCWNAMREKGNRRKEEENFLVCNELVVWACILLG